jgi:sugar lactone lactonase YvrE
MTSKGRTFLGALTMVVAGCSNDANAPSSNVACATATPASFDMSMFGRAEGLVIGPDGTVYFSDFDKHVMRYAPPYAAGLERTWATVENGWIFGVMLDPKRKVIYAGSRSPRGMTTPAPAVYRIDVTDPTKVTMFALAESGINGLTMGDDGSLFYADQCCSPTAPNPEGGHLYRVTPDGVKTRITKTPIDNADGIAFGPDKALYVIPYLSAGCPVTRLTLDADFKETARETYVDLAADGGKNGDGIAFDKDGNMYLTAAGLYKVGKDKKVTKLSAIGGANIEFGAGALACHDLLWATNSSMNPPQHITNEIPGQDVYWHRP